MNYVIAIAGPIGSGKTSLTNSLAKSLDQATTLYFDDYERITNNPAKELVEWLKNGADINQFNVPGLADDLQKLKQGETVVNRASQATITPRKYIIFEMPMGREHSESAPFIDLLLWLEIPLDIAITRKLKEYSQGFLEKRHPDSHHECLVWLDNYFSNYQSFIGDVLAIQKQKIRPTADLELNGRDALEKIVLQAADFIRSKLP